MAYGKYRILQAIVASALLYFVPALSMDVYAMGGCPETCENQHTSDECTQSGKGYGCYDTNNNYHQCKWLEHFSKCIPDPHPSTPPIDTNNPS